MQILNCKLLKILIKTHILLILVVIMIPIRWIMSIWQTCVYVWEIWKRLILFWLYWMEKKERSIRISKTWLKSTMKFLDQIFKITLHSFSPDGAWAKRQLKIDHLTMIQKRKGRLSLTISWEHYLGNNLRIENASLSIVFKINSLRKKKIRRICKFPKCNNYHYSLHH